MSSSGFVPQRFIRKRLVFLAAFVAALGITLAAPTPAPVYADPDSSATDDEGGTKKLRDALDVANRAYTDAKRKLDASKARQTEILKNLPVLQAKVDKLSKHLGTVAAAAYRGQRINMFAALLESGSPDSLAQVAETLHQMSQHDGRQIRELRDARKKLDEEKTKLDNEITTQQTQLSEMAKRKNQALKALRAAGGGDAADGFGPSSATAQRAPRNPDGSWPRESCSVNDPTTSGCLTPRTYHALKQAKAAGFTRYVACFRSGGNGEHPKGRACDFAAAKNGFEGVATGDEKTYGNRLASWFVANDDRLGVMYVIWFKRIWMPSSGWRTYGRQDGSPSGDHTNHVHLSVY